jgi:FkbM family methyltransferase
MLRLLKFRLRTLRAHPGLRRAPFRALCRFMVRQVRLYRRRPATVEFPRWHARLSLPTDWGGVGTTMIYCLREEYEPELRVIERFVKPGHIIVDAGASCGIYTVAFAKLLNRTGRVLAFEPGTRAHAVLESNIRLNRLTNAAAFQVALTDRTTRIQLHHGPFGPFGYSLGLQRTEGAVSEEVVTSTLDEVLRQEALGRLDLLKMDVEGAEELVVLGGQAPFQRFRPVVIFEFNPQLPPRLGLSPTGSIDALRALGYDFYRTVGSEIRRCEQLPDGGNLIAMSGPVTPAVAART